MQNLFHEMENLLRQKPKFFSQDGSLLRNLVIEKGLKLDPDLLHLLLSHDRMKQHFFIHIDDLLVFDKEKFLQFVNNKEFLPDSYTSFKNKIGLSDDGGKTFLSQKRDVSLVWPYKDCVLEGDQTDDEQVKNEIFWNENLAPDDISHLLSPKVLTKWLRYDNEGLHEISNIDHHENLIIKGNNLLALHSLKVKHNGKVKLIYIDPPYNTGRDGFNYNDRFDHSVWLTFLRNRLEVARSLLSNTGAIFIQIDDNEQAYLKLLLDQVFGRENFIATVIWQKRNGPPNDKTIGAVHEYVLVYAKDTKTVELFLKPRSEEQLARYKNPDNHPKGPWTPGDLMANVKGGRYVESLYYPIENTNTGELHYPSSDGNWRFNKGDMQELIENNEIYWGEDGKGRPKLKRFLSDVRGGVSFSTIWAEGYYSHTGTDELRQLFNGRTVFDTPKPEELMKNILLLGSKENDLVMDFFAGSGTTAAVAHKMNRKYICVEQMDYIQDILIERMKKVIDGEQGGISQIINWQGGGEFIYCELLEWNEIFIRQIEVAKTQQDLRRIWQEIQKRGHLCYQVDLKSINEHAEEFGELSIKDQKKLLLEVLDKNALYVNYSEIDDVEYGVSQQDKYLNHQFYGVEIK